MRKEMTPCEELGYKVGDKFKVVDGTGVHYAVGRFITLIHDDGSSCPRFNGVHAIHESGDSFFPLDFVEKVAKLKPAKQALADAIHQNGGWVDDTANWAVKPKHENGDVWFSTSESKPYSPSGGLGFTFKGQGSWLGVVAKFDKVLPNWHQCILSRDEYYQAYPKADDDGWIEWKGGERPVYGDDEVDVVLVGGSTNHGIADEFDWHRDGGPLSVASYRLHKPDVKPEFCESVMRSIPEPESIDGLCAKVTEENKHQHVDANPTIEQLAQDYRNKLDFAKRKQQEADDAKAASDAALGELERAGEALGLLIGIAKPDLEPELVITDWRDLRVGDVVECVRANCSPGKFNGMTGEVIAIDYSCDGQPVKVLLGGNEIWCYEVKFISRP